MELVCRHSTIGNPHSLFRMNLLGDFLHMFKGRGGMICQDEDVVLPRTEIVPVYQRRLTHSVLKRLLEGDEFVEVVW